MVRPTSSGKDGSAIEAFPIEVFSIEAFAIEPSAHEERSPSSPL